MSRNTITTPPARIEREKGYKDCYVGEFSFFRAPAKSVKPYKTVSIKDIYKYITMYEPAMAATRELRAMIRLARENNDVEMADVKKFKTERFDFACFSGVFNYRKDESLVEHSRLLCLDFDHVGKEHQLWTMRDHLIKDEFFTTWLLFTSPSGDGLKWVIEIDLDKCDHRTWFRALQNYIRQTYNLIVDEKCINESRACFLPHDANCYVNPIILHEKDVCPF